MKNRANRILEAKDLQLFRKILSVLGDYSTNVPMTGIDHLFDTAVEKGMAVMPKDKHALAILRYVFTGDNSAAAVHKMLNIRFSDLPDGLKPMAKQDRRRIVASWSRDSHISDRVRDLVDWDATGKQGQWTDINGDKVEVADTVDDEEENK